MVADDAISFEPHFSFAFEKETKGLNAIFEKGHKFGKMLQEFHSVDTSLPLVARSIAFKLMMDVTMKERPRGTREELCVSRVKEEKIIAKQFFI